MRVLIAFNVTKPLRFGEGVLLFALRKVDRRLANFFRRTDNDRHLIINKDERINNNLK